MTKIKKNGKWIDIANLSTSDIIRNPDWSRVVQLTNTQFTSNSYRFPEDGIFINASLTKSTTQWCACLINNLTVGVVRYLEDFNICIPVCAGDLLMSTWADGSDKLLQEVRLYFVPYRAQITQAESHEIIQIANKMVNGSTVLTDSGTEVATFTFPKKGVYFININITAGLNPSRGIVIMSPYCVQETPGSTASVGFTLNIPSDNYVLSIKARCNGSSNTATITSNVCQGQAIKLY